MSNYKKYLNAYEFEVTPPGSGETVRFKPLSTGQIKKLLVHENDNDPRVVETVLDEMISNAVISPEFDIDKLYLQDRFFLLVELRKKSKGTKYQFRWKCPECETQNLGNVDISKMKNIPMPEEIDYIVTLDENLSLRMKYVTRGEIKKLYDVHEPGEKDSSTQNLAELAIINQAASIESIITPEGEETPSWEDKLEFANDIPQLFYEKMSDWLRKYNFGIDFTYNLKCKGCKKSSREEVPLEDFFF